MNTHRKACLRCRRPEATCFCSRILRFETKTRVVFLQHPRERKVAIGTARMAHLSLPNSELHLGTRFDGVAWLEKLANDPDSRAVVLFPGEGSKTAAQLGWQPKTLVVLDGTWSLAHKLLKTNPVLQKLPRVAFNPRRPGNYRIRKEPAEHCLSTIEAVAEVLGELEGRPGAFDPMLEPFEYMVDRQLEHVQNRTGPSRHKRRRSRERRVPVWKRTLNDRFEDLVLVYAEASVWGFGAAAWYPPELVHWVATRPATGECFEAFARPTHPLGPNTAAHLEVHRDQLEAAPALAESLARFEAFLRPNDLFVCWGHHTLDLLRASSAPVRPLLELRGAATEALGARSQGVEDAAARLGSPSAPPWAAGRTGRRLSALHAVVTGLK